MNHSTSPCCRPSQPTMSSLEIANLTGKDHRNVIRDIRSTLEQAGLTVLSFEHREKYNNNNTRTIYNLPRAECDLVISGYSVKYRWTIIQRWHELERKVGAGETAPQPAVDHYELYQEATALLCKLGGTHGRGAAITMLAQFDARTLPHVARERLPEFIAACKKVLGATANPAPTTPALTQHQVEEITQRIDNLTRLFHPHSQPFADVMGIARALRGLDPKLGARAPAFVPLLPDAAPAVETPLRQQVVQTLRAEYSHGDYKALARDLGIHESSAKKIVGRLKLGASA